MTPTFLTKSKRHYYYSKVLGRRTRVEERRKEIFVYSFQCLTNNKQLLLSASVHSSTKYLPCSEKLSHIICKSDILNFCEKHRSHVGFYSKKGAKEDTCTAHIALQCYMQLLLSSSPIQNQSSDKRHASSHPIKKDTKKPVEVLTED